MTFEIQDHEKWWIILRSHVSKAGLCKPDEENKIVVFLGTCERWRSTGVNNSTDWWVWYPQLLFSQRFFRETLEEARHGEYGEALRDAFGWLLKRYPPSVSVGMVWYMFIGCHKRALLEVLGVSGPGTLNRVDWDLESLLGIPRGDRRPKE